MCEKTETKQDCEYVTIPGTPAYEPITPIEYSTPGENEEILEPGTYKLEVWGAQGGSYNSSYATGGKGGYSYGTLTLEETTDIFVYVGGQGTYSTDTTYTSKGGGGFNGGGNAGYLGGGGGGATDIRIGTDDLCSRILVAGGGGGAYAKNSTYKANGGAGGGTNGVAGSYYNSKYSAYVGGAATATAGGTAGTGGATDYNGNAGTFGVGGDTGYKYNSTSFYSNGAGGGGWYGGGAAGNFYSAKTMSTILAQMAATGGGGGSGFVYTASTVSQYPSSCSTIPSISYLTESNTVSGNTSFTDFDGSTVTGHSGDGAVRITGEKKVVTEDEEVEQCGEFYDVTTYYFPVIVDLNTEEISKSAGEYYNKLSDVEITNCPSDSVDCYFVKNENNEILIAIEVEANKFYSIDYISSLEPGDYTIYYLVTVDKGGGFTTNYKYPRTITVTE